MAVRESFNVKFVLDVQMLAKVDEIVFLLQEMPTGLMKFGCGRFTV